MMKTMVFSLTNYRVCIYRGSEAEELCNVEIALGRINGDQYAADRPTSKY